MLSIYGEVIVMKKNRGYLDPHDVMGNLKAQAQEERIAKVKLNPKLFHKKYFRVYNLLLKWGEIPSLI